MQYHNNVIAGKDCILSTPKYFEGPTSANRTDLLQI